MALRLYAHPFSSYSQKALIALYENGTTFEYRALQGPDSEAMRELGALWPMRRFPVLVDGDHTVFEASCVIEYLDLWHPGPRRLVPEDPRTALEVRMLDRFFDNYVSTPQQKVVFDRLRPEAVRDPHGVVEARTMLVRLLRGVLIGLDLLLDVTALIGSLTVSPLSRLSGSSGRLSLTTHSQPLR